MLPSGSWSRCTVASWMKRIGSSQPSTMTHGPGPGLSLLYPALSSLSWHHPPGSLSQSHRCSLLQGQQSQAPAGATAEAAAAATTRASPRPRDSAPRHQPMSNSPGWGLLCSLPGLSTPQNACNKVVHCARVRLPPSVPAPPARASRWDSAPPCGFWRQRPRSPAPWAVRPLSPAAKGGGV